MTHQYRRTRIHPVYTHPIFDARIVVCHLCIRVQHIILCLPLCVYLHCTVFFFIFKPPVQIYQTNSLGSNERSFAQETALVQRQCSIQSLIAFSLYGKSYTFGIGIQLFGALSHSFMFECSGLHVNVLNIHSDFNIYIRLRSNVMAGWFFAVFFFHSVVDDVCRRSSLFHLNLLCAT